MSALAASNLSCCRPQWGCCAQLQQSVHDTCTQMRFEAPASGNVRSNAASTAQISTPKILRNCQGAAIGGCQRISKGIGSKGWQTSRSDRNGASIVCMGIKAVENFNTDFELDSVSEEILQGMLKSDVFASQVATQPGVPPDCEWEWSGILFQPVPWSVNTKFGMPQEYEKYLQDKQNYVVVNVPPNYMFQAKIFKPSRLCAIFRRKGVNES